MTAIAEDCAVEEGERRPAAARGGHADGSTMGPILASAGRSAAVQPLHRSSEVPGVRRHLGSKAGRHAQLLGFPVVPFCFFLGGGSPT